MLSEPLSFGSLLEHCIVSTFGSLRASINRRMISQLMFTPGRAGHRAAVGEISRGLSVSDTPGKRTTSQLKLIPSVASHRAAVGEISRGLRVSDTPGIRPQEDLHPEGVPET